jgi:hypothetical protein
LAGDGCEPPITAEVAAVEVNLSSSTGSTYKKEFQHHQVIFHTQANDL